MVSGRMNMLPTVLFAGLIGLALYFRFKRSFGRQPVAPRRMMFRMGLLALLAGVMLVRAPNTSNVLGALGGGVVGAVLGFVALASTRFEVTPEGRFYTPNQWIAIGVIALVLGRVASRFFLLKDAMAHRGDDAFAAMNRNPLTLATFFVLATYYVVYAAGVLRRARA
jgi:hypothetical protein